ncbi:MAG: DUF1800 domain-containing protein [Candidatus Hydrogenedentes bacterium]|nr:DUF1800 domain-containing protein [Candidatus Hydrogenedentota bacterium]
MSHDVVRKEDGAAPPGDSSDLAGDLGFVDIQEIRRIFGGFSLPTAGATFSGLLAGCPTEPDPDPDPDPDPAPDPETSRPPALPENLRRLVARTTFGINQEEAQRALDLGYDGYLEYQLDHDTIDDSALEARLASLRTLNDTPRERLDAAERNDFSSAQEFLIATVLRGVYSKRQLYERMVEFWSDHFNIYLQSEAQLILKPLDDAEAIRPFALSSFPEILRGSARSPSMLVYLDNASSVVGAPNENYARELMELHTVGVDQFSQQDVKEVARVLTGWSINLDLDSADFGRFLYYPEIHDWGEKSVLGRRFAAGRGIEEGEELLQLLSTDPEIAQRTAAFIGRKLALRFWGYEPPDALVEEIAAAYLDTDGDIKSMLRVVLREGWLMQAAPRMKRPYHYALSSLRAIPSELKGFEVFGELLRLMEHLPFHWAPPNGYPDSLEYWGNYLMPRWTYGVWLLYQQGDVELELQPYLAAETDEDFLDEIEARIFHHQRPAEHREALAAFLASAPENIFRRVEALSMAIASADFQWY